MQCEPAEPSFSPWVKQGKVSQMNSFDFYVIVLNMSPQGLRSLPAWKEPWWKYVYLYANGQSCLSGLREWSSFGLSTYLIYLAMISLLERCSVFIFPAIALHDLLFPSQRAIDPLKHLCRPRSETVNMCTFVPHDLYEHFNSFFDSFFSTRIFSDFFTQTLLVF